MSDLENEQFNDVLKNFFDAIAELSEAMPAIDKFLQAYEEFAEAVNVTFPEEDNDTQPPLLPEFVTKSEVWNGRN